MQSKVGIILMTYGSATTAANVAAYMDHIYKGRASKELVADFENRYRLVGRSPLIDITKQQAALLEAFLNDGVREGRGGSWARAGGEYLVRAGMLHSAPFIDDAVAELKSAGIGSLRGMILSPQFSSFIMEGYRTALVQAAVKYGFREEAISLAAPWPTEPHFIKLLAARIRESLAKIGAQHGTKVPVLFTTHSLPKRVVDKDPDYLRELKGTINATLSELNRPGLEWYACYQSAGHTPEEWLKPDLTDILDELKKGRTPAVLVAPIQFLADHLEILYDLDIAAKAQCVERGIAYHRIELPNLDPRFIRSLATTAGSIAPTMKARG